MITKTKKYELKLKQNEFSQRQCAQTFLFLLTSGNVVCELSAFLVQIDETTRGTASVLLTFVLYFLLIFSNIRSSVYERVTNHFKSLLVYS